MSRFLVALSLCLLAPLPLFAGFSQTQDFRLPTAEEKALRDVSFAPGAPAVILDWVVVDDDPQSVSSQYYRIKILADEGKKYGDVEVPYVAGYPVKGRVVDISARTIQPDGSIVPFDGKVYDKVLYKGGGLRVRAKTFSLAGVQPGSIIEYRYQRRWSESVLLPAQWEIQRDIPVLRARMNLKPYDSKGEFASFFTYHNLAQDNLPSQNPSGVYELEAKNIAPFQSEDFAPPEDMLRTSVNFYYTHSRVHPSQFWSVQAADWNKSIEKFIGRPDAVRTPLQGLMGASAEETLKKIYAKVQSYKNYSFIDDASADEKRNAAEVVAAGEGYRDEINRAFVALARAAGFDDASVVRVAPRNRFFFSQNVPDAGQLAGEIAMITVGSQVRFFDPGTPTAPFGIVSWEKSNVPGVRIAKGETPAFRTFASQGPEQAVVQRKADLQLKGDVLEGSVVATFTGQEALSRRVRVWGEGEAACSKQLEEEARGWFPAGATLALTKVTGTDTHAEPLVATFHVSLANVVSAAGSRSVLPISVFASAAKNPFAAETRTHPIYFHYPRREEDEVKVTLPAAMALAAVPAPIELKAGAVSYTNAVKPEGNAITFTRSMTVDAMLVDAKYYRSLRNFYSAMAAADQKPLVLVTR